MTSHLFNKFENVCKFYRFRNRTRAFPFEWNSRTGWTYNYTGVIKRQFGDKKKINEIIIYIEQAHGWNKISTTYRNWHSKYTGCSRKVRKYRWLVTKFKNVYESTSINQNLLPRICRLSSHYSNKKLLNIYVWSIHT